MKKISDSERTFIRDGFRLKVRSDGRGNTDIRDLWFDLTTLQQANGSCTIHDPDTSAQIHIGVKIEIGTPTKDKPDEGIINISIDSSQRQTVSNVDKREITDIHQEIKYLIEEFMIKPIDKKKLCLVPGKICWVLNIDVFSLAIMRQIYIDKISLGIKAALHDLEIPELKIVQNQITSEYDIEVIDDKILGIRDFIEMDRVPIVVTIGEIEKVMAIDLTDEEFQAIDSKYVVAVDFKGDIFGVNKIGGGGILFEDMPKVFKLAKTTSYELMKNQAKYFEMKTEQQKN